MPVSTKAGGPKVKDAMRGSDSTRIVATSAARRAAGRMAMPTPDVVVSRKGERAILSPGRRFVHGAPGNRTPGSSHAAAGHHDDASEHRERARRTERADAAASE